LSVVSWSLACKKIDQISVWSIWAISEDLNHDKRWMGKEGQPTIFCQCRTVPESAAGPQG